ncbi:hypothetical protein ACFOON_01065 [Novosphingobium piscinae]|uniref:Uncharacterized protein n=1 Tax=Novosphingobium piscinae TaxID=1507448 RepID=A0A7X1KNL9_9SPHN|nr:hypothetical protein [Novosphingobium piscinae]MBC2667829.1 hypothetical protein [Novosphingobium piscinae]
MIEQQTRPDRDPDDDSDLIAALAALPRPEAPPALLARIVQSVEPPAGAAAAPPLRPAQRLARGATWGAVAAGLALGLILLLGRQAPPPSAAPPPGAQVAAQQLPAAGAAQAPLGKTETARSARLAAAGPVTSRAAAGRTGPEGQAPLISMDRPASPPAVAEAETVPTVQRGAEPEAATPVPQPVLAQPAVDEAMPRLVEAPSFGPAPAPRPTASQRPPMGFRPAGN